MADPKDGNKDKFGPPISKESGRNVENRTADRSKVVEVNADEEGDVSDISEEERNSTSSDHHKSRTKRKVKKKRRSKSLNSNDGETTSSDEDVSGIVASNGNKPETVNLVSFTAIGRDIPLLTTISYQSPDSLE